MTSAIHKETRVLV